MRAYFEAFKFNALIKSTYKLELVGFLMRHLIRIVFLIYFWYVLGKTNTTIFDVKQLVSYFLIGIGVSEITMSNNFTFGRDIQKQIKRGEFTNSLIKPVHLVRYSFISFLGRDIFTLVYSVFAIALGIALYPPTSPMNIVLFFTMFVFTFTISLSFNMLLAVLGFYTPEAGSIKNVLVHLTRILSGALIPLSYFPNTLKTLTELTPFPALVYYPVYMLQNGFKGYESIQMFVVSLIWAVLLFALGNSLWKKALRNYDGVGI